MLTTYQTVERRALKNLFGILPRQTVIVHRLPEWLEWTLSILLGYWLWSSCDISSATTSICCFSSAQRETRLVTIASSRSTRREAARHAKPELCRAVAAVPLAFTAQPAFTTDCYETTQSLQFDSAGLIVPIAAEMYLLIEPPIDASVLEQKKNLRSPRGAIGLWKSAIRRCTAGGHLATLTFDSPQTCVMKTHRVSAIRHQAVIWRRW
jgi:hypothetical protein